MACINQVNHYLALLLLIICLGITSIGYTALQTQDFSTEKSSQHFHVTYKSIVEPLPLHRIHSWVLHVDTLSGSPVERASISVFGGMPAHKHGLPTQPIVTEIGNGDYLVEGLKFSMTGIWQIRFDIRTDNLNDETTFTINF